MSRTKDYWSTGPGSEKIVWVDVEIVSIAPLPPGMTLDDVLRDRR